VYTADRHISFETLDLSDEVKAILRASAYNEQILPWQEPHEGNPINSAIRYETIDRPRPKFYDYEDLAEEYGDSHERILDLLDFEQTSRFQMDSWQTLSTKYSELRIGNRGGAVISAPTGFGKTAAFMGQIYKKLIDGNANSAILVFPSRALLQDQLSRVLRVIARVRRIDGEDSAPSVGLWYGRQPRSESEVSDDNGLTGDPSDAVGNWEYPLSAVKHWNDEDGDPHLYVRSDGDTYVSGTRDESEVFDSETLVLHKNGVRDVQPDILLTTLESLEGIAMKPHYQLVPNADFFVFDEIHQYTGLRGAHAANIIRNIQRRRSDPALYIGASATIEDPQRFAQALFNFEHPSEISHLSPRSVDIDKENEDEQHYFFLLTPDEEDSPGVASQYIQQALMTGYALLQEDELRYKALSFINSKSQIHRLADQVSNAVAEQLWDKHTNGGPGDWRQLSHDANREFTPELKDPVPLYSGSDADLDDISGADFVHGTSYLEIGVDISNLKYIFQYRPPNTLASFFQRAGRGGREWEPGEKMDSFIFTCLSSFDGDANFFYRADSFIDSSIKTPIEPNNPTVNWMHDRFFEFYEDLSNLKARKPTFWWQKEYEQSLLEDFFEETLGYERFVKFLFDSGTVFDELVSREPVYDDLIANGTGSALNCISEAEEQLQEERQETSRYLAEDSAERYLREDLRREQMLDFRQDILDYSSDLEGLLTGLDGTLSESQDRRAGEALEHLEEIKTQLAQLPTANLSEDIEALHGAATTLYTPFGSAQYLGTAHDIQDAALDQSRLQELVEGVQYLHSAENDGKFEEWGERQKILYYLRKAVNELDGYLWVRRRGPAHGSLAGIKSLFQSAYFLNKCYQIHDKEGGVRLGDDHFDDEDSMLWYVPPNYFDDAGRYFTLCETEAAVTEDNHRESEESIHTILNQYSPYRTEFLSQTGKVQTFMPNILRKDGELVFNFSSVAGREHKGVKVPDRIELTEVTDQTGIEAKGIHQLHPETYQLLTDEGVSDLVCAPMYARIFPQQEIRTDIELQEVDREVGDLKLADVDAKAWLEAVTLDITEYYADDGEYFPSPTDIPKKRISRDDTKLGYLLETRGITWNLSEFTDSLNDDLIDHAGRHKSFEGEITPKKVALTTAAHFLTVLVSDVTGVNTDLLLYGIDEEESAVHVFEQTQGGQGIIDLFFEQVERNPTATISSVYQLCHNPQVYEERIWCESLQDGRPVWSHLYEAASSTIIETDSADREALTDAIKEVVESETGISYPDSNDRISEFILKTIESIQNIVETTGAEPERLFELKSNLAERRIQGSIDSGIPDGLLEDFEDVFTMVGRETVESVLLSPDIDDCEANLQLQQTISEHDQKKVLSHIFLEEILDYVVDRVSEEEEDSLYERGQYWARKDADELIYLRWEQ